MPTIQNRRATAAQWTAANPVLTAGEIGFELDTNKLKVGDGVSGWQSLNYFLDEKSLGGLVTPSGAKVVLVAEDEPEPPINEGELLVRYALPGQTYYADFSEDTIGGMPAGWTPFGQPGSWQVVAREGATNGQGLVFTGTNATSRTGLALDAITPDPHRADVELLYRWYCGYGALGQPVVARGSADATPSIYRGIGAGVVDSRSLRIHNYVDGVYNAVNPFAFATQTGTWYQTRARFEGEMAYVRQWVDGEEEPMVWQTSYRVSVLEAGLVGLLYTRSRPQVTDWLAIATGGRKAVKV